MRNFRNALLKKSAAVLLAAAMMLPTAVSASQTNAELPKAYWPLMDAYVKAVESQSPADVARTGDAILKLFGAGDSPGQKAQAWLAERAIEIDIVYGTSMNVLEAYEKLGDDAAVLRTLKTVHPFMAAYQEMNNKPDPLTLSGVANKLAFYDAPLDIYAETEGGAPFYGAKHEPQSGVLFGESYSGGGESPSYAQSSAGLVYVEFESETVEQFDYIISPLAESGKVLEIAWNLSREGESLASVAGQRAKIESAAKYLAGLDAPILLRFGGEMNIWEKKADPQQYISAFRQVADIMRGLAPNVAMVWSPNFIGHAGTTYEMFYPGDEYVDWVGVSLYTSKYFMGDKNQSEFTQAIYSTGKYANPVAQIAPVAEAFGGRKPIMMSEGGVENYSVKNQSDETAFALERMRLMYGMIPVVYPQVKAMLWFNKYVDGNSRYTLSGNAEAQKLYGELVAGRPFIKTGQPAGGVSYKKLGGEAVSAPSSAVTLLAYAPFLSKEKVTVTYRLDGKWLGASELVPHRRPFDLSAEADGAHSLAVSVTAPDGSVLRTSEYELTKSGGSVSIVKK